MKKIVSLLLAVAVFFCMETAAFSATNKINGIADDQKDQIEEAPDEELRAGESVVLRIRDHVFKYSENGPPAAKDFHAKYLINTCGIGLKATFKKGSQVIDKVEIADDASLGPCIRVTTVDPYVSTDSADFELSVQYTFGGRRSADYTYYFSGTVANDTLEVSDDKDFVSSNGRVLEAVANIKKIEVDVGNGVIVSTRMVSGRKYYGIADLAPSEDDDKIIDQYPDVDTVINLRVIGLNGVGSTVDLSSYPDCYVYDKDLKYLGTSADKLPCESKYYLAYEKLDVAGNTGDTDEEDAEYDEDDGDGEEDENVPEELFTPASNANDNPGTGR